MAQLYVNIHAHIYREICLYMHTHISKMIAYSLIHVLSIVPFYKERNKPESEQTYNPGPSSSAVTKAAYQAVSRHLLFFSTPLRGQWGWTVCAVSSFNPEGLRQDEEDRLTYGLDERMNDLRLTKGHMFPTGGGTRRRGGGRREKKRKGRRVKGRRRH